MELNKGRGGGSIRGSLVCVVRLRGGGGRERERWKMTVVRTDDEDVTKTARQYTFDDAMWGV